MSPAAIEEFNDVVHRPALNRLIAPDDANALTDLLKRAQLFVPSHIDVISGRLLFLTGTCFFLGTTAITVPIPDTGDTCRWNWFRQSLGLSTGPRETVGLDGIDCSGW